MAWAALIPVAMQLLKGDEKQQPQQQMPPPPSLGEIFKSNAVEPVKHDLPTVTPYQAGPVGGGSRGF